MRVVIIKELDCVLKLMNGEREELYDILKHLISFKTPNPPGLNENEAQEWIAQRLRLLGFEVEIFDVLPGRPNVIGKLSGTGGGKSGILNSHIYVI